MRINEAYDHEPIMPCDAARQTGGCDRTIVQCVDISAPVTLTPTASVGTVVVACQGLPTVTCTTDMDGTSCSVVMTQQVCVSIPVQYGVELTAGQSAIACADDGSGTCNCRRS